MASLFVCPLFVVVIMMAFDASVSLRAWMGAEVEAALGRVALTAIDVHPAWWHRYELGLRVAELPCIQVCQGCFEEFFIRP